MRKLSRTQLETLAEGLLQWQVRLNDLTIRLYRAVDKEAELFQCQWHKTDHEEELPVVMSEEIETVERSLV